MENQKEVVEADCDVKSEESSRLQQIPHKFVLNAYKGKKKFRLENYVSKMCRKSVIRSKLLKTDQRNHVTENTFRCFICHEEFKSKEELETHTKDHIKKEPEEHVCRTNFFTEPLKDQAIATHSTNYSHICNHCNVSFPSSTELKKHCDSYAQSQVMKYESCEKTLNLDNIDSCPMIRYTIHYSCPKCSGKYTSEDSIEKHLLSHVNNDDFFPCECCGKKLYTEAPLRRHLLTHKIKVYVCDGCKLEFSLIKQLKNHLEKVHAEEIGLKCVLCKKKLASKSSLAAHCLSHTKEKVHAEKKGLECVLCKKKFASYYALAAHCLTHANEKPYYCDICGKTYRRKYTLKQHYERHISVEGDVFEVFDRNHSLTKTDLT